MRRIPLWIIPALSLAWLPNSNAKSAQIPNTAEDLARRATFIFIGTVARLNATTIPDVKPTDSTVVVRVDEVIEGPGAPPDLAGKEITVQLSRPGSLKAGQRAAFFTKGWLLGDSMAVIEVGSALEAGNPQQLRETVKAARERSADETLQREIATADLVVTGRVTTVSPSGFPELPTEHTPRLEKAVIEVESTLKGHVTGPTVTVFFPGTEDPYWAGSPKFQEGQQGIWLLHRNQAKLRGLEDRYTALNTLDFQSLDQSERIQRLAKGTR